MKAWHFVSDRLRDGSPVPADGVKLTFDGKPHLCARGFHASVKLLDALKYAPGHTLCRVELGGQIVKGGDKLVATERTILWRVNAESILRKFARQCAIDVLHLWDAQAVVVEYLKTGKEELRDAARDAAWAAASDAARDAAWAAAGAVAGAAARAVARAAARAVAWAAAGAVAGAAARAVARAAARDAAREKQNRRLVRLVMAARKNG